MLTSGKPKVYVGSSTISYLTARPTEDTIRRAKQIFTHQWWQHRESFELFISRTVIDEIERGDPVAAGLRIEAVDGIPLLPLNENVERMADVLLASGALPENAALDAEHIAFSSVHKMDFLITWNQRHIATEKKRRQIEAIIEGFGYKPTRFFTPEQHLIFEES